MSILNPLGMYEAELVVPVVQSSDIEIVEDLPVVTEESGGSISGNIRNSQDVEDQILEDANEVDDNVTDVTVGLVTDDVDFEIAEAEVEDVELETEADDSVIVHSVEVGSKSQYENSEVPLIEDTDEEDIEGDIHNVPANEVTAENEEFKEGSGNAEVDSRDTQVPGESSDQNEIEHINNHHNESQSHEDNSNEEGEYAGDSNDEQTYNESDECNRQRSVINIDSDSDIENLEESEEDRASVNNLKKNSLAKETIDLDDELDEDVQKEIHLNLYDKPEEIERKEFTHSLHHIDPLARDFYIPLIVKVIDAEFLLCPVDHTASRMDCSLLVSLCDNLAVLKFTLEEFFEFIRLHEDLKEIHEFPISEEIVFDIPELNIRITEDNLYAREVTLDDFIGMFTRLSNATKDETLIPTKISFIVSTQSRFITNFNDISEAIRLQKGFESIDSHKKKQKRRIDAESESESTVELKKQRVTYSYY